MTKFLLAAIAVLFTGCAGAPSSSGSSGSGGSITMYGTVDQGVTVHN